MFKITLNYTPSALNTQIAASGSVLNYNGIQHDFSALNDGDCVPAQAPAMGTIKKVAGVVHIELEYHVKETEAEPMQSTDINDYIVNLTSGDLACPIIKRSSNV